MKRRRSSRRWVRDWLDRLGPGVITGASDDAGIQEISARIGLVTGRALAANLRARFPPLLLSGVVVLLLVANVINIGADIGAMAAALRLMLGDRSTASSWGLVRSASASRSSCRTGATCRT